MANMWVWIGGIAILFGLVYFINKYQNGYQKFQGNLFNGVVIGFVLFLVFSLGYVYFSSDVNLLSLEGIFRFVKLYFSWIVGIVKGIGHITGYIIQQNWAVNATNISG